MVKIIKRETRHNQAVRNSANWYKRNGYDVKADVSGFKRPPPMNGSIADVVARKADKRIIIEFETESSVNSDRKQRDNLRKFANTHEKTVFKTRVVRK